jgi:hypothetical protein
MNDDFLEVSSTLEISSRELECSSRFLAVVVVSMFLQALGALTLLPLPHASEPSRPILLKEEED